VNSKEYVKLIEGNEYIKKRALSMLEQQNPQDEITMFTCADSDGFMNMVHNSVKNGIYCDVHKLKKQIDRESTHVLFFSELAPDNRLRTMWWVKTNEDTEPIMFGLTVDEYIFEVNAKIILTKYDEDGDLCIKWLD
jgi:hypothetical protein